MKMPLLFRDVRLTIVPFCSLEEMSLLFEMVKKITWKNESSASEGDCECRFSLHFFLWSSV